MKAAHLENEINPFASAFRAPYAWSSRKGHGSGRCFLLLEMSIGRGRLEKVSDKCVMGGAVSNSKAANG